MEARENPRGAIGAGLPVDGHVHLHACFDLQEFLDRALYNFRGALPPPPSLAAVRGVLMFTESAGDRVFRRLRAGAPGGAGAGWTFSNTAEEQSLLARRGNEVLVLMAGFQIVTRESLEVLSLGCDAEIADGLGLSQTVERVRDLGGVPVVPWGFGKWWLARRRAIVGLLESQDPSSLFVGDNGGRPRLGPRPWLFPLAERLGFRILPGSDPLPFPDQARRAGSFGFLVHAGLDLDLDRPAEALKRILREPGFRPAAYGRGEGWLSFARNQIAMQWRKRRRGVAP